MLASGERTCLDGVVICDVPLVSILPGHWSLVSLALLQVEAEVEQLQERREETQHSSGATCSVGFVRRRSLPGGGTGLRASTEQRPSQPAAHRSAVGHRVEMWTLVDLGWKP